ncbi:aspartate/glutamate racemase family protein [Virgibacillus dakarensis]|nr:aspartate/glutamate racemase family protein [Virgibacillus dakarensis]
MHTPTLGILMLDTNFHRPKGDIGNPETFPFSVEFKIVKKATIERVVKMEDSALIEPFVQSARHLQDKGVKVITTSCGFLSLFQQEIQSKLHVPFYSSSLMQIPLVYMLTGGKVGVLTARKSSLTKKHLEGVNAHHTPVVIQGMDHMPAFTEAIVNETDTLDMEKVSVEMRQAVTRLIDNHPDVRSIILECTNMPPYRSALREVTDLPIFDILTLSRYVVGSIL